MCNVPKRDNASVGHISRFLCSQTAVHIHLDMQMGVSVCVCLYLFRFVEDHLGLTSSSCVLLGFCSSLISVGRLLLIQRSSDLQVLLQVPSGSSSCVMY